MTPQATGAAHRATNKGSGPNGWYAETHRDDDALARLATEWDDLYERCSAATAFLSSAWLESWWRSYGTPGRLVVVTVRHGPRLVAGAAVERCYRLGLPVLRPIGVGISDFSDILLDDHCAHEAAGHLARELARWSGYTIDLPEVPEYAAVWTMARAWPLRMWRTPGSICLDLPARPLDEVIDALPRRSARTRRAKSRKIEEARIATRIVDAQDAADVVATLLALHREQWRGRGMNPEHRRPRFAAHLERAVPAMVDRGQAVLLEHVYEGRAVAVGLMLGGNRMIGAYLYGHRPDLRKRIDVTQMMLLTNLEVAQHHGASTLSLLRGDEPNKRQWHPRAQHNARMVLACPGALTAPAYALGIAVRSRLADFVKSRSPRVSTTVRTVRRWFPFST